MTQTTKPYDILVFIGRFQPFHRGHKRVIDTALEQADRVVVLIGSANSARSIRNPWTYEEREGLLREHYSDAPIDIFPLDDILYNDTAWLDQAQGIVADVIASFPGNTRHVTLHGSSDIRIGLIGAAKDSTSYYLKMFPGWPHVEVKFLIPINATDIRTTYFRAEPDVNFDVITDGTLAFLHNFSARPEYNLICDEAAFVTKYKQQWEKTPYPVTFSTVDAVVIQSGHILLVTRKGYPGKGQLALPGGFINQDETLVNAALRELREETRLKVPAPVLLGSLKLQKTFDEPMRSSRGRTITHAFLFHLAENIDLPKVKGGDDAAAADWYALGTLNAEDFFEDHWHIVKAMTAGI